MCNTCKRAILFLGFESDTKEELWQCGCGTRYKPEITNK